ncbi:MAG: TlpA family protein disulfide reductase [Gemmataceae bacterium]
MKRFFSLLIVLALSAGCADPGQQAKPSAAADKDKASAAADKDKASAATDKDKADKDKTKTTSNDPPAGTGKVELTALKSDAIIQKIEGTKGIVVVDSWATWCIPCRQEFPNLVKIHEKFGKNGVTCMSVTIDEADQHEAALKFLEKVGARFPNFRDEGAFAWLERWKIKGVPFVLVYQDGKLVKQFDKDDPNNQYKYEDVIKLVEELVKKKGS